MKKEKCNEELKNNQKELNDEEMEKVKGGTDQSNENLGSGSSLKQTRIKKVGWPYQNSI